MFRSLILSAALMAVFIPAADPVAAARSGDPREVMGLWDISGGGEVCRLALRLEAVAGGHGLFHERCDGRLGVARLWRFAQGRAGAIELVTADGDLAARLNPLGPDEWRGVAADGAALRMVRAVEY